MCLSNERSWRVVGLSPLLSLKRLTGATSRLDTLSVYRRIIRISSHCEVATPLAKRIEGQLQGHHRSTRRTP